MGCMMVKRAPECQTDLGGPVIKPVCSRSVTGAEIPKCAKKGSRHDIQKSNADAFPANKKLDRYTAKFEPRVIAKYDIKALIGKGTFSRVFRVEQKATQQPYAIKVVDKRRGKNLFDSEVNVLLRAQHPNIIRLIEVFEGKYKLCMVVDLAAGGRFLDHIMERGSFTEKDACDVLKMILDGLRYLHSQGITHRNLNPENILFQHEGPDSKILLTDFGLSAHRKKSDEFMDTICGSPEYIAPEVLAKQLYTSQVDMWAVGVISYILLSGTMPFSDENHTRLYRSILKGQISFDGKNWSDISSNAKDFITALLKVDPNERMTAAESLKHPWLTTPAPTDKNLHGAISKFVMDQRVIHLSERSARANKPVKSGRFESQRVTPEEVEALHREVATLVERSSQLGRVTSVERSSHLGGITKAIKESQRDSTGGVMTTVTWSYEENDSVPGPSRWGEVVPEAKGHRQSPIFIAPTEAEFDKNLADNPLRISYNDHQCRLIQNNGRSVQVTLEDEEDPKRQARISGGPMEGDHPLRQFHFHWGSKSNAHGSEHRVPGRMYVAELHLVHWNSTKYSSFEEAFVSKDDGIVVLAIFLKVGQHEHKGLGVLTQLFEQMPFAGDYVEIPSGFNPFFLLPDDLSRYWTYLGSVTAPPCYESVRFIVFRDSIEVSEDQMNAFRSLRPVPFTRQMAESKTTERRLVNNFRPTMPLYDRTIRASFQKSSRRKKPRDAEKRQKVGRSSVSLSSGTKSKNASVTS